MRHRRRTTALPARVHRSVVGLAAIGLLASGTLSAPGAVESTEIALQDAGTITWFVEDDAGSAVHGTTYEVTGPDGWSLEVGDNLRTDTNTTHGTVTIDGLPDGKFTITPTGPEDVVFGGAQSVEVSEGVQDAGTPIAFVVAQAQDEHEPAVEEEADPVKATKEPAPVEDEEPVEPTDAPGEGNQAGVEAEELGEAIDGETAEEESAHQFATEETPADEIAATDDRPTGETGPVADGMATARFAPNRFPTPAPADNPELPLRCGLDIAIVLDLSNSLSNTDVAASQDAAVGFADALQGTPSSVGVYTFATYAPDRTNAPLGKTSVATGAGANQVSAHIRNLSRVPTDFGGTNWDRGFSQVPTGEYDVIVFITDGNPTAYGQPGVWNQWTGRWDIAAIPTGNTDRGTATDQVDINTGTASSNAHKTAGTFVIGLGVGAVDADNISYISGNRLNTDYFLIANYGELAAALETIALENCLGTLTVVKQERALDGSLSRGQDWTFSTADPDVSPASGQTDSNGAVNFEVGGFTDEITQRSITVSEVQQPGFSLEQQSGYNAACTDNVTGSPVPVTNGGVLGFTVEVAYDAAISCQMINTQHPTVTLQKSWVNAMAGDSATLTINGQPTAPVVVSEVGDSSTFDDTTNVASLIVSPGQQVNVTELLDATGHYVTDLNCVGAEVSYTGGDLTGSFTMPAQNVACTFTNALEFSDLTVTKTAVPSFDRAYSWSIDKVAGTDRIEIPEGETASADYDVTVTAQDRVDSNIAVTGVITVANPNAISFAASVTDSLPGASCTVEGGSNVTVPANGTLDVNYACTADSIAAVADTNEATVTWDVATYPGTTGTASGTAGVTFGDPASETDRTVRIEDVFDGADPVLLPLDGGPVELDWVELTAGEGSYTVSYEREVPGEAGACTDYLNTASVIGDDDASLDESSETVTVCVGADLEVAKNVVHSYDRTYAFEVDKSVDATRKNVDPDTGEATFDYTVTVTDGPSADSNWVMSGTITVHNPNSWTDITADVTDTVDIDGGASCVVTDGAGAVVPAGSSLELDYTCTFTEQPSYDGTNTATAVWAETLPTPNSSASGTAAVSADEWDVRSINQTVTVLDDQTDPTAPVELGEHTWSAEGTSTNYTYQLTLEGTAGECVSFTNTAWIDELPDSGDSQDVTVCWPQDLTVTKTVGATYDTEYFWDLSKEVDRTEATVAEDGTAEFTYVVTATPDGSQDSGWAMAGEITVANPNATDVTVDVTDTAEGLGDGVTCTVTDSELSVPAHGEASTAYACTFDEQPAYDGGTNTATITWTGVDDVEQTATHVVDVDFTQDEQTNVDVQVWDDEVTQAAPGELLGTAIWSDGPQEFTYTLSLPGEASTCVDHTNTAVIPKTGDVADQTVWVCVELAPQVEKTAQASFDREYFWDIVKEGDRTEATVTEGGAATFDYVVSATPDGSQDSGWAMNGQVTVTNPNTFDGGDLTVTVTDVPSVGGECTVVDGADAVLAPAETRSFDYTCAFEEEPEYAGTNLATVAWTGAGGTSGTVTVEADVDFILDGETNATVEVFDDKVTGEAPGVSLGVADWHEGGEEFAYSLELSGVAGECTDHTNTALIPATGDRTEETVTVCTEAAPEVAKTADASFDREYFWDLTKVADATQVEIVGDEATFSYLVAAIADGFQDSGWEMSGEITVTNPNTFQELTATVTDLTDVGGTCVVEDGEDFVLAAGETRSLDYACTFGEQPAYLGSNTAHVAWTDLDGVDQVSSSDPVAFEFQLDGETNLEVDVRDDKVSGEAPGELLGSATWHDGTTEFGYELTLPGVLGECVTHTNTAVISDTGDEAQADVTICVEDELVITKTAEAAFDRDYAWNLAKEADQTQVTIAPGGAATFDYTVSATPGDYVDSNWSMSGQISVTNPNAYAEGTVTVEVTDEPSVGGSCAVVEGEDVVLAPGETRVFDYDCTFTEQPDYEGTNSATVTWSGPDGAERAVTTQVPVTFEVDGETNRSVEVTDDKVTGEAPGDLLGTAEWNAEGTPTLFEYSLTLPGEAGTCVDHTNTAVIPAAGDEAQQVVTVCVEAAPQVAKTVEASYDRSYDWQLAKEVDRTSIELTEPGAALFTYVVTATPDGYTDSGWAMSGEVTVTNPNDFQEMAITVSDEATVGGSCVVAEGEDVVLAAGETRVLDYECTFEEQPDYEGSNTAVVTWTDVDGAEQVTSSVAVDVSFALADEAHLEVEVYDDMVTGEAPGELLGTADWRDGPTEFTYGLELDGVADQCVDYTNTAVISATGDEAQQTVHVCVAEEAAPEPPIVPEPVDPTPVEPEPVDPTPVVPEPVDPTPVEPEPVDPTPVVPEPVDPTSPAPPAVVIPTGDPVASGPQVALVVSGLAAMLLALLGAVLVLRRRQD